MGIFWLLILIIGFGVEPDWSIHPKTNKLHFSKIFYMKGAPLYHIFWLLRLQLRILDHAFGVHLNFSFNSQLYRQNLKTSIHFISKSFLQNKFIFPILNRNNFLFGIIRMKFTKARDYSPFMLMMNGGIICSKIQRNKIEDKWRKRK